MDPAPDQLGADLVVPVVQAHDAVPAHLAALPQQEHGVEFGCRRGRPHLLGSERPALLGRVPLQAAVGRVVVLVQPQRQTAVEGLEAGCGVRVERRQELVAHAAEKPLDFSLPRGLPDSGVDQSDPQPGAQRRQVARAVVRTVIHVEPLRNPALEQSRLERRQERLVGFGEGEGCVGDDPRGVVQHRQEVGLAAPAPVAGVAARLGAVQHVALPQLVRETELEAAAVLRHLPAPRAGGRETLPPQQAVDRGPGQLHVGSRLAAGAHLQNHLAHRQARMPALDLDQRRGRLLRHAPQPAAVGAGLGVEGVESALPVQAHPVPERVGRHAPPPAAGNRMLAPAHLADRRTQLPGSRPQMQQLRNQAEAEQRDLSAFFVFLVGGFPHV